MSLDPLTLWSVVLLVGLMLSAAMILVWLMTPDEPALAYWASFPALLSAGIAGAMARGTVPDFVSIELANTVILLGYGLVWTGLRVFDRRRARLGYVIMVPLLWILLCQFPMFRDSIFNRIILLSFTASGLMVLCLSQLWRGWAEPSRMRGVVFGLMVASMGMTLLRIPFAGGLSDGNKLALFTNPHFVWIGLVAMLIMILVAFALVLMVRERVEMTYRSAAERDALTGLLNRRGFMKQASPVCQKGGVVGLMIFDLDRFKLVNDRFGHAAGDRVLMVFAEVLRLDLGPADVVGRIGGEEFVALLPGVRPNVARQSAERIQRSFRDGLERLELGGGSVECSVSIGLAIGDLPSSRTPEEADAELVRVMAKADGVLYEAKFKGRNRIETVWFGAGTAPAA